MHKYTLPIIWLLWTAWVERVEFALFNEAQTTRKNLEFMKLSSNIFHHKRAFKVHLVCNQFLKLDTLT